MAHTVAEGDIRIDLSDKGAIAELRALDKEFDRTMRSMDGKEAEVRITGNVKDLKRSLKEAQALEKAHLDKIEELQAKKDDAVDKKEKGRLQRQIRNQRKLVESVREEITLNQKVTKTAEKHLDSLKRTNQERSIATKRTKDAAAAVGRLDKATEKLSKTERALAKLQSEAAKEDERRTAARAKALRDLAKLQSDAYKEDERRTVASEKAVRDLAKLQDQAAAHDSKLGRERENRERTHLVMQGRALDMDRKRDAQLQKEALSVAGLQRKYAELERHLAKMSKERGRARTIATPGAVQRIDIDSASTIAEMERLRLTLSAMGQKPIDQKINLDANANFLGKWLKTLTETTVRVGPFTTTIATFTKALALLGPVVTGLVGQLGALTAAIGAGLVGALGVGAAAIGAFGISLGGVAFLLPSLLRDFKNLNTLQDAYHKQVLKTGADSDKAKTKLEEFNHALGEVTPTTRRAFLSLDKLQDKWRGLRKDAKPDFFNALGASLDTVSQHFDWFSRNTLAAFHQVSKGWQDWMKGLQGGEATRILQTLGKQGNASIRPLMASLGALVTAFGRVAESFSRYLPSIMRGFRNWSQGLADATGHTRKLNDGVDQSVQSFRSTLHLIGSLSKFITALFVPAVSDGTDMIESWADGLDRLTENMKGPGRSGIQKFFKDSIDTANKFWQAIKPLAELFFEWTTVMRPFTDVALFFLKWLGKATQAALGLSAVKFGAQTLFGVLLLGATLRRLRSVAASLGAIGGAVKGISAAGGIGAALKGGLGRFVGNQVASPGATPAHPMYVFQVNGGGVGKGPGNLISKAPKTIGGIGLGAAGGAAVGGAAFVGGFVTLLKVTKALENSQALKNIRKDLNNIIENGTIAQLDKYKKELGKWGKVKGETKLVADAYEAMRNRNATNLAAMTRDLRSNWKLMETHTGTSLNSIKRNTASNMSLIKQRLANDSDGARAAVAKNFRMAAQAIKRQMDRGAIDAKRGSALIKQYTLDALTSMGLSKAQAASKLKTGTIQNSEDRPGNASIGRGTAVGGLFQLGRKGQAGQDTIPMNVAGTNVVAAPGEQVAVFNRHQQKKFAASHPGGLEGFFSGPQRPHYMAGGGIVPVPGFPGESAASSVIPQIEAVAHRWPSLVLTDAFGSGHSSPGHTVTGTAADFSGPDGAMDAAVKSLVAAGYLVGYDGRFGSQNWPGHGPSTKTSNYHFHVEFGSKGLGAMAGMLNAPDVKTVQTDLKGAPGVIANQGMGIVHGAAQAIVQKVFDEMSMLTTPTAGGGAAAAPAQARAWLTEALKITGQYSPSNLAALTTQMMSESGGNPRAINLWDSNAKAGHPSKGLLQTIDSTFQQYMLPGHGNIWDPVDNAIAAIRYMVATYGHIVGTGHGYAQGGIVDTKLGKKGGRVNRPTLVGEHPMGETVISHEPQYRKSNIENLFAAARVLGIGTARGGKGPNTEELTGSLKPKKHRSPAKLRKNKKIINKGGDTNNFTPVKEYGRLQGEETDTQREISIAESKFSEPDTFLKQTGTDEAGNPTYAIDDAVVRTYVDGLGSIVNLYNKLLDPKNGILAQMTRAAKQSYSLIAQYIAKRDNNIATIDENIAVQKQLLKSKNKGTRQAAADRLDKLQTKRDNEKEKRGDARDVRKSIKEDQHDAGYRYQEYEGPRSSTYADMMAAAGKAAEEIKAQAPDDSADTGDAGGGVTYAGQVTAVEEGRYAALQQYGSNYGGSVGAANPNFMGGLTTGIMDPSGGMTDKYGGGRTPPIMSGATRASSAGTSLSGSSSAASASRAAAMPTASQPTSMDAGGKGDTNITINQVNHTPPPDPHTMAHGLAFELQGAL